MHEVIQEYYVNSLKGSEDFQSYVCYGEECMAELVKSFLLKVFDDRL
jgi:hypothetical protein